ncbi:hypothetical protein CIB84_010189 [Bambusicola thoracicus]|uniref:Uncharacterized protein n=1 Tax=Bambusicola thoracicus TaxID=9083 RepID=A0A2P4SPL4_BAMTH|nr:hypothetical protein CIB84_010189 [Bambusicola thoracicus]
MPGRGRSRVPERWTDYVPLGRRLPGTRFIAFKVPLRKSFNQNLHPEERFSPCDLIEKIKEQKEELGLIIDLTYTTRYYGPEVSVGVSIGVSSSPDIAAEREDLCEKELPATLRYSKILTMGHEIPNNHTIFQFKCVVKNFLRDNRDNGNVNVPSVTKCQLCDQSCLVGLLRYLIDVEGMEPNAAIECTYITQTFLSPVFNRARGHPIERMNYIEDLRRRSGM